MGLAGVFAWRTASLINGDGSPVLRVFTKSPVEISFHRAFETFSARIIVPLAAFLSEKTIWQRWKRNY